MLSCSAVLASGCVAVKESPTETPRSASDFCAIAEPIFFDSDAIVDILMREDEDLVRSIVTHNEQVERLCP